MNKTIGVFAHVDAGKTTFSESLLFHTQTIKAIGRVDHKNAFLDTHKIEKERGITIFAEEAIMAYKGDQYFLIDTPGHIDFTAEVERSILVMDYAILIISAVEGVQGHTETVWQLLESHHIPTFVFINKIDRIGADFGRVVTEIQSVLSSHCILATYPFGHDFFAYCAEQHDELLALYLEDEMDNAYWLEGISQVVKERKVFPCFAGSALQDQGVLSFFEAFHLLTNTHYKDEILNARVYKISFDSSGTKVSHLKVLSGSLTVRDELSYKYQGKTITEKITQLRVYSGGEFSALQNVTAGMLVGAVGLSQSYSGMGIGLEDALETESLLTTLKSKVTYDSERSIKEILSCFRILEEENPALNVQWDESVKALHIHVLGVIQLEILKSVFETRFGMKIDFQKPRILYKETISGEIRGYGHFEPLKHYAEVHLKLEQGPRGTGIQFENKCHADDMTLGHQRLVEQHVFEKEHRGILTGSPLTDIKVSLLTGRGHNEYTSGGDFREATYRAIRQGLEKASNVLLEPFYKFRIRVSIEYLGRVLSDIQKAYGTFFAPEHEGEQVLIRGRAPVSTWMDYPLSLAALSGGRASIQLLFDGYDLCHNPEQVIADMNYNKDMDTESPSSSVFCVKGKGYSMPWDETEEKMHCPF